MNPDPARKPSSDPDRLEIRPPNADDFDQILAIAEILENAAHWSRAHYEDLLPVGDVLPDQTSRRRIALIACDSGSGEIFGFVAASLVAPEAELESIAVASGAQRKGIGRRLLASLVTSLRAKGISDLHLEVRASNQAALAFYGAQNFKQTGVRPRYYTDHEEDAVLMTLHLAAPEEF
jgi:[ribosomal protein S18]-alanine N-acetyltransferase